MVEPILIEFDSVILTSDNTVNGTPYLVEIEGLGNLMSNYSLIGTTDFKGNYRVLKTEVSQKSKQLTFRFQGMKFNDLQSLIELKNTSLSTDTPVNLVLTHPYDVDFSQDLDVNIDSISWSGMLTATWRNVEIVCTTFEGN